MPRALGKLIQEEDVVGAPRHPLLAQQAGFKHHALEALRPPLEEGVVTITRASVSVTFPARLTVVGAMNPSPRGRVRQRNVMHASPQASSVASRVGQLYPRRQRHQLGQIDYVRLMVLQ
jgi:Magnesium chelatase, subunit ChlI